MDSAQRLEIHELLSRAAYALDERDLGMLAGCFATGAEMRMRIASADPVGPFQGRDGIMQLMRDSMAAQTDKRRHVVSNIFFEDATDASVGVVSNLTLFASENGVIRLISAGLYRDRVMREDGAWRIASRFIELDVPY